MNRFLNYLILTEQAFLRDFLGNGPRQSGKSTLVQAAFPDYLYVNLKEPAVRARALVDPTSFVATLPEQSIIDEAQYAPELFSAIQAKADRRNLPGQFVLSGSQNFLLLRSIKQSLAGRVGIAYLMPLSYPEIRSSNPAVSLPELMVRGLTPPFTPRMSLQDSSTRTTSIPMSHATSWVILTCATSAISAASSLPAQRAGNLVNYADLARDIGVSVPTVRSWFSILESSFVVNTLASYSANIAKRLTRTSKLYFCDTGLLCHLLGIGDALALSRNPLLGPIFESFVLSEQRKRYHTTRIRPNLMFYRDDSKIEVGLVDATDTSRSLLCEIKPGQTYRGSFTRNLRTVGRMPGLENATLNVVYGGEGAFVDEGVSVFGIREWHTRGYLPIPQLHAGGWH